MRTTSYCRWIGSGFGLTAVLFASAAVGADEAASDAARPRTPSIPSMYDPAAAPPDSRYAPNKPPFANAQEFEAAFARAQAGDAQAVHVVVKVADECSSVLNMYPHKDDLPRVAPGEFVQQAIEYTRRKIAFCHSLDPYKIHRRSDLVWRAARSGDRRSILDLRWNPPRGPNAPLLMPRWKHDVLAFLEPLRDDPEALYALGDIYVQGKIVDRDYARAIAYYADVVKRAPSDSVQRRLAQKWIGMLATMSALEDVARIARRVCPEDCLRAAHVAAVRLTGA